MAPVLMTLPPGSSASASAKSSGTTRPAPPRSPPLNNTHDDWTGGFTVLPSLPGGGLLDIHVAATPLRWIAPTEESPACIANR